MVCGAEVRELEEAKVRALGLALARCGLQHSL